MSRIHECNSVETKLTQLGTASESSVNTFELPHQHHYAFHYCYNHPIVRVPMSTLKQLLSEALRANAEDRNDRLLGGQETDEMSGFILENVQVATMPYIEFEDENEVNPLVQFARKKNEAGRGGNPKNFSKLTGNRKNAPPKEYNQRIWLAPGLSNPPDEESSSYPDDEEEEPEQRARNVSGSSRSNRGGRGGKRVATAPPLRLEKEPRSCFARLLFSKCWTAKDEGAGWRVKRRCPTKGSLSCPCGNIGPCKNVKAKACPLDQLASTKQKQKSSKKSTGTTAESEGATFAQKPTGQRSSRSRGTSSKVSRKNTKTDGKPLMKKLLPCCFKDHKHTECCCRCPDNPKLSTGKNVTKKSSLSKMASHSASEKTDEGSDEYEDEDYDEGGVQTYNVRSFSDFSKLKRDYFGSSRKNADSRIPYKRRTGIKKSPHRIMKGPKSKKPRDSPNSAPVYPVKSTTSFQITLHPMISEGELPESEVVKHQILKTLSTIHGPIKVEQKIVVQGSENSTVIVTHGESCQCKLCHILKSNVIPNESVDGSPQAVKMSTNKGGDTLIKHSDGCKCDLCEVLDPAETNCHRSRTSKPRNENLVVATCSASNLNSREVGEASKAAPGLPTTGTNVVEDTIVDSQMNERVRHLENHSFEKKSMSQANNAGKKMKRCPCTKCRQKRRVERLKLRLKKDMGSEKYEKMIREITRRRNANGREADVDVKPSGQSDSEDGDYGTRKKTKKSVSFSDDPDPEYYPEYESRNINGFCGKERNCALCEELKINRENLKKTAKKENKNMSPLKNHDSTVYSVHQGSEESEREAFGSGLPKQDVIALTRKSKALRKGSCHQLPDGQTCFPPKHIPGKSLKQRASTEDMVKKEISEEIHFTEKDAASVNHNLRLLTVSSEQCRRERDLREQEQIGQPDILEDGAFPKQFVSWSPGSRSNMATANSSESYYVPDDDEFPVVNMEFDESVPSSGRNTMTLQRIQIPLWFRMLPDRSPH